MKKSITLLFLLVFQFGLFAQIPRVTIFQNGKEYKEAGTPIELKNQPFSVRYYLKKDSVGSPLLAFYAEEKPFSQLGSETGDTKHAFSMGTIRALSEYKSYWVNTAEWGYKGCYYLKEYAKKIPSDVDGFDKYEFYITQIEGLEIKDLFLENLYIGVFFDKNKNYKFEDNELYKYTLHFSNHTQKIAISEDIINLEQINFKTFDANSFFEDAVKEERIFKGFSTAQGYRHYAYSEEDSLYIHYEDGMYSSFMKSVLYRNLKFPIMQALTTLEGELVVAASVSSEFKITQIQNLLNYMNEEHGEPEVIERDDRVSVSWEFSDRLIQFSLEEIPNNQEKFVFRIYAVNKKYIDDIRGKMRFGIWRYID